ncbi:MAG: hypothetical protein NWF09_01710 [Candidatus Bathyarchaeota archaeon]|nr:hypothetical protein [Candidatus Bathyarchaeota archaeon]
MSGTDSALKEFILPFSALSENRKEPFTAELEAAAVFALAEEERAKGGGLISARPEEKIAFIAKIGYPLWLFPWQETTLIFDGLNRANATLSYAAIPDVGIFMENLKRGAKTRETYLAFLSDYLNYFQAPATEKSTQINGLISSSEFLKEFDVYRREAAEISEQHSSVALLSPLLEEASITAALDELKTLHSSLKADHDRLYWCMKFLNKATRHYVKLLHDKAKAVRDEFAVKIKAQEELIEPKITQLKEDYDHKIIEATKNFEKQEHSLQKEKVKLEKSREAALAKIEHYKLEAKTRAEKDDRVGEQKWKEKANEMKKELSEIEEHLKGAEKSLKDLEERKSLEIFNLRNELEAKVKEARQPLLELESSRDAKLVLLKQESETLEQQTKLITEQLGRTAKLTETFIENFARLGLKQELPMKDGALFYVPFYVACYQVDSTKRYLFFPPSVANAFGFSTRIKGALGKTKIKQLLTPRFEVVTSLMDTLQVLAYQNAAFEAELRELCESLNMLKQDATRESIKRGVDALQKEGWLSEKEQQALSQKIA